MKIFLISIISLFTIAANGQINSYLTDLKALKDVIEAIPSFKVQIRGEKRLAYNDLYKRLASDSVHKLNSYTYFYNLAQLLFPIRDNHLGFYQLPDYSHFRTKESIDSFVASKEFLDYPTSSVNIDSLRINLESKPIESIEGIYHYDTFYRVGLYSSGPMEYSGVVLDSDTSLWRTGQIAIHLYAYAPGLYKAVYGHPLSKNFLLQTHEKYQHGALVNSYFYGSYSQRVYSKELQLYDHVNLPKGRSRFELKNLNNQVQYILIQSFQANKATQRESLRFYDSIENALTAPALIVDLRNNEGGARKEMKKYYRLLKKYVRKGQVYILMNNSTISQAEIFTLKLLKLKRVTTAGQNTKGMLTYGSNYGKRIRLPSGRFEIYPTDMNDNAKLLPYEDHGIRPDIELSADRNWIEQLVEIIQQRQDQK